MPHRFIVITTLTAIGLGISAGISKAAEPPVDQNAYAAGYQQQQQRVYVPPPKPAPPQVINPYKPLFFDNDFTYGSNPNDPPLLGDSLNQIHLADDFLILSAGGELRFRPMDERNRLRPGGPGRSTYNLWRWRQYFNLEVGDWGRAYVEFIDASAWDPDLPLLPIDVDRWEVLNAFVDVNLETTLDVPGTFRVGRQEMLYGKQRLVSPLDWSNTRRNFQGLKYLYSEGDWDLNIFATNPVNAAARGIVPVEDFDNNFNQPDYDQFFSGVYSTYRGFENSYVDLYWLWLRDTQQVENVADGFRHTVGLHWNMTSPVTDACGNVSRVWDLDFEGAYQFGSDNSERINAGFFTGILGHTWKQVPWQPRLSGLFYWGSGDQDPNDDETNTFSVLYPLGHAYWGILDNLAGQNLLDYSAQLDFSPAKKWKGTAAWHWFDLASTNDFLYNVAGAPLGTLDQGQNIGNELDLIATYTYNPNFSVSVGYSWFWYGEYVHNALPRDTATQFYLQTHIRY
ncbi:hypothetical protein CA54_48540 [Symmachiella macrocystis]|uniref:Alginate export domain-containing protein n=1 Tax=Symmachiella macrocystis TaxID=2527985 RepID=A0A5C6BD26_9PLAN|nr:alginate export family protein [Symmachiella macrocystis]TWU09612.1 hypothetical protein CA54_48540 [Symmachiella macrocystis]